MTRGISQNEERKLEMKKKKQALHLKSRIQRRTRTLADIFALLGPHSPYYTLSLTLNALMFAIFNHLNEMDNFLIYTEEEQVYTDDRGRIVAPEHPTVMNANGNYATSNGAMDLTTLLILNNISSMAGCIVTILIAQWSYHKSVITFSLFIVASYLLSQAFLFNFFDRIAFVIGSVFSKSLSIITIQAAFESGHGKYRIWAIGFSYYLSNCFVFITLLLFKKDKNYAETHFMFIITGLTALYALMCPSQLLHSIVRRDVERVKKILKRFGKSRKADVAAIVDDVLFVNRVPKTAMESLTYLIRIKPFVKKMVILTFLVAIQTRLNSGEMEMIKTMLPYSPMESILISRVIASLASIFAVFCISKLGRRPFLLMTLFSNLFVSYVVSLVPIDTYSACFSKDMPGEESDFIMKTSFISLTVIRTFSTITIFLMTLEHIPTIHRCFVFPVVMLFDSVISSMSDSAPYSISDLPDTPQFIRPMLRYSMLALLLTVIFIDDSDVTVFHTNEMPCYNVTNPLKKNKMNVKKRDKNGKIIDDFEEKFRLLCEVKDVEDDAYTKLEKEQNIRYQTECETYLTRRTNKVDIKGKLKDSSLDSTTMKDLRLQYLRKMEKNKKCIEASRTKLTNHDEETRNTVHSIQKNRLKD